MYDYGRFSETFFENTSKEIHGRIIKKSMKYF